MKVRDLKAYLHYVKTKYKPRSNSYQSAVEECIDVLAGKFSEIRKRDKAYEQDYRLRLLARRRKRK